MELRHIAFGNLRRRKGKAALITFGLAVAVAAFVLVLSLILSLRATMDDRLSRYGSNLLVTPPRTDLDLSYGGVSVSAAGSGEVLYLAESDLAAVQALGDGGRLAAVIPVRLEPVSLEGRTVLVMGTDLAESAKVKLWWRVEGSLPDSPDEVLLGLNVRNEFGLERGDTVDLGGRSFTVSGVLWETGDEEDNLVVVDREALTSLTGEGGRINLIEVTAASTSDVEALVADIERALPGVEVTSVMQSIEFNNQADSSLARFGLAVMLLIVVISGLVVTITMLTAVQERQKEIGIFRAVGFKQRHIATLIVLESAMLSSSAAVIGVVGGLGAASLAPRLVRESELGFFFDPLLIAAGVAVAFLVGLSAAVYPAWRAARMDPATALKYV
ncbi:MAG: ABC transporter permease [Actinobacteria bacterium]|nr:ABC transporter permease [Actinomycetota bacterium]